MKFLKKHYHFVIAVLAFLLLFFYGGALNTIPSYHILPVTEALSISRTQFAVASTLYNITSLFFTFFTGKLISKFGFRISATAFLIISAIGFLLMSTATNYFAFLLGYAIIGISYGICNFAGATYLINEWFVKHRGAVLGFVTAATGIGGSVLGIIQSNILSHASFRESFGFIFILFLVFAFFFFLLVRNKPADIKLEPFGIGEEESGKETQRSAWSGYSFKKLCKRPVFYMLLAFIVFSCMLSWMGVNVLMPHLQDVGLSTTDAGTVYSIYLLLLTGGKFLVGSLCDKFGAKLITLFCVISSIVALFCLLFAESMAFGIFIAVLFAFAMPIVSLTIPLLSLEILGYRGQKEYISVVMAMPSAASMLSALLSNGIFDLTGSYKPAFLLSAIALIFLVIFYLIMCKIAHHERDTFDIKHEND